MSAGQLSLDVLGAPSEAPVSSPTRAAEDYWTPPSLADAIVRRLDEGRLVGLRTLEPHVGGGSFVGPLHAAASIVYAVDRWEVPGLRLVGDRGSRQDFCAPLPDSWRPFDTVLGNPPFSEWEIHARRAFEVLRPGGILAFILPSSVISLAKHQALLDEHPLVLELRIAGRPWTVVRECSVFVWRNEPVPTRQWSCERLEWRR